MEERFIEDGMEPENDDVSRAQAARNALLKRRELDDVIEERRLKRRLRDYDFDLGDE